LFDLANTLTDRAASIRQFSWHFFEDFRSHLHEAVTFDEVHKVMQVGDGGGYRPKEMMFQEILTNLQWDKVPAIETITDYWYRVSARSMQLRPDVHQTLGALQQRGLSLGMITNGKTNVQNATIDATNLREYFSVIIISEACGFRKPDPQIFHLALSALQTSPEQAVYIGDHPQSDIEGARNAGLYTVWFAGVHAWSEALLPPKYQITQLSQLLDVLG